MWYSTYGTSCVTQPLSLVSPFPLQAVVSVQPSDNRVHVNTARPTRRAGSWSCYSSLGIVFSTTKCLQGMVAEYPATWHLAYKG
jgi:hypothetical protein